MATITTNLKIPKPDGNEYFNRTEFNNILDVIDQNAASKKDVENIDLSNLATKEEVTTHKSDMAKHNQFMDGDIKKQISFGINSDLGCLTINISEAIE